MTKFSVGGDEDGEGTSSSHPLVKRSRLRLSSDSETVDRHLQVFYSSSEDEEHHKFLNDQDSDGHRFPFGPAVLNPHTPISAEEEARDPPLLEVSVQDDSPSVAATSTEIESQPQAQSEPQPPVLSDDGCIYREMGREMSRDSISVTLTDTDVLDCPVCYEPFTVPVFQCENGHTACSHCCRKLEHRCPSCTLPIGYSRCRAIEKVIESVKISCPNLIFGCEERIAYGKKLDHEKTCIYAPCECPHRLCNFADSSNQLYLHSASRHADSTVRFVFNRPFHLSFTFRDTFLVLQEETKGILFIMHNKAEPLGNAITMSCIGPSSVGTYAYSLIATKGKSRLRFHSVMTNTLQRVDDPPSLGFLLVPSDFFGKSGGIGVLLSIRPCNEGHGSLDVFTPCD